MGRLPGQEGTERQIRFATPPGALEVEPWRIGSTSAGRATECAQGESSLDGRRSQGYNLKDVFRLEACIFSQICTNGDAIFQRRVGEPFVCQLSLERFEAFRDLLLAGPAYCSSN